MSRVSNQSSAYPQFYGNTLLEFCSLYMNPDLGNFAATNSACDRRSARSASTSCILPALKLPVLPMRILLSIIKPSAVHHDTHRAYACPSNIFARLHVQFPKMLSFAMNAVFKRHAQIIVQTSLYKFLLITVPPTAENN